MPFQDGDLLHLEINHKRSEFLRKRSFFSGDQLIGADQKRNCDGGRTISPCGLQIASPGPRRRFGILDRRVLL